MKYKVGDKVRVRTDLIVDKIYGADKFILSMCKFKGKICTIKEICDKCYLFEEDDDEWYWTDEMLEDVSDNNVGEIKARTVDVADNSKEFHDAFVEMIDFAKEHLTKEQFNEFIYTIYTCGIENVCITEIPVYENVEYHGCVLWKRIKSVEYKVEYNHESKKRVIIGNKSIG